MSTRTIFLSLGLFTTICCSAQRSFKAGRIVTNDNKVVDGFINYREWIRNPTKIEFSISGTEKDLQVLGVDDILSFEITGEERYEKYRCRISMDAVITSRLKIGVDTSWREEAVFLKVLEKGKLTLFRYQDDLKERFFFKTAEMAIPAELVYRVYNDTEKERQVNEDKEYINQLIAAGVPATRDPKLAGKINRTNYKEDEMKRTVRAINNEGVTVNKDIGDSPGKFQFFLGAGLHSSDFAFEGDRGLLPTHEYSFSHSTAPVFFGGVNFYLNPKTARLLVRTDISFFSNSHNGKATKTTPEYRYDYTYDLKYSIVAIYIGPAYNFLKQPGFDAYLGAGALFQLASVSENKEHQKRQSLFDPSMKTESDIAPIEFNNSWITFCFRAGVVIKKKVDIAFCYSGQHAKMASFITFREKSNYIQLRAAYNFGKKKA